MVFEDVTDHENSLLPCSQFDQLASVLTPERQRLLHKYIFVGEERRFRQVEVFHRGERRSPRHGYAHPGEPPATSCVVSTPYSRSTCRRGSSRRSHTHRNRLEPVKNSYQVLSPVTTPKDGDVWYVHAQFIPPTVPTTHASNSLLEKSCNRRYDMLLLVFCQFGIDWQSHDLVTCPLGFRKISSFVP